ncbi:MAG: SusD/RagB family nutrient-binding outer membrane lipoprotein [Fimbriimonadaceae bacterium]|nr:SusD/RagB family nutrient-binding outer membrane lipoprotein [Chitinophagales bacterium]
MKKYNLIFSIITAATIVLSTGGCKQGFLEGYDVDPNNPVNVSPDLILTTSEVATATVYGGDYARYSDMWMQHQAGTDRQFSSIGQYVITESDVDNTWRFNAYGGGMIDLYTLIQEETENGNFAYVGVAKILMAANLGLLTDGFGDIPYSQAFQGADDISPAFDSQESIYNAILDLLTTAHTDLDADSPLSPGDDDIVFGGDVDLWHGSANALKARYLLHLANRTNDYAAVLAAIDAGGIADNSGDMQVPFGDLVNEQNLWFQFYEQRSGYLSMGAFLIDLMNDLSDPRLPAYATLNDGGIYNGAEPGEAFTSEFSVIGLFYGSANSPIPIITYAEQKFIEAEAAFETGDDARAASAHNEGVAASLDKVGVTDAAYIAANGSETAGTISLEKIMEQKYIALFTQFESWTDYRRTGFPAITPAAGQVPLRFPYPSSERLYNGSNVPAGGTISSALWWDVD